MRKYLFKITGISLAIIICVSFIKNNNKMETAKGKWISLFDGKTFDGWHNFNKTGSVTGWDIGDGSMVCLGAGANGGDIVTNAAYENFELKWEWKISKEGNSGVLYHVVEDAKYSGPYQTGPEYQLIDDVGFPQKLEEWQKTGADYAMNVPNESKKLKPVGEWNTSKIVFNKGHVEHWLNEAKIVEFQAWDAEWTKKKTTGKWKDYPDYGLAKTGLIALQDHGHKTFFKNIMIKEL